MTLLHVTCADATYEVNTNVPSVKKIEAFGDTCDYVYGKGDGVSCELDKSSVEPFNRLRFEYLLVNGMLKTLVTNTILEVEEVHT